MKKIVLIFVVLFLSTLVTAGIRDISGSQAIVDTALATNLSGFNFSNLSWLNSEYYQDYMVKVPVPEPATLLYLGSGLLFIIFLIWRRQKKRGKIILKERERR